MPDTNEDDFVSSDACDAGLKERHNELMDAWGGVEEYNRFNGWGNMRPIKYREVSFIHPASPRLGFGGDTIKGLDGIGILNYPVVLIDEGCTFLQMNRMSILQTIECGYHEIDTNSPDLVRGFFCVLSQPARPHLFPAYRRDRRKHTLRVPSCRVKYLRLVAESLRLPFPDMVAVAYSYGARGHPIPASHIAREYADAVAKFERYVSEYYNLMSAILCHSRNRAGKPYDFEGKNLFLAGATE